jgi:hypothetical protein
MSLLSDCLIALVAVMDLLVLCCAAMAGRADREMSRGWREGADRDDFGAAHCVDGR